MIAAIAKSATQVAGASQELSNTSQQSELKFRAISATKLQGNEDGRTLEQACK